MVRKWKTKRRGGGEDEEDRSYGVISVSWVVSREEGK
jgi:hypothetical protein